MDKLVITKSPALHGDVIISGAKNAALPLLMTSLLADSPITFNNVPALRDITTSVKLLEGMGTVVTYNNKNSLTLDASVLTSTVASYELVRTMRASILVLGPLLAKHGHPDVSLPGSCAIGARPVNLHLTGLEAMGAKIDVEAGYIKASVNGKLQGAHIFMDIVSVGATENLMMAAALAQGTTVLENAAREPEVADLAHCLVAMGAEIEGIGTDTLKVTGKPRLHGAEYSVVPDRIETGTYAIAAAITGGEIELVGTRIALVSSLIDALREAGIEVTETEDGMIVRGNRATLKGVDVMTEPYPGFPTDMQAQFMALMTVANGASMITETIFENRFMHVPELSRMGSDINVHGRSAIVRGSAKLSGAEVMATDLRASVSMVLAGLAAEGETVINRVYHLDRGYERLEEKLAACGAKIERVSE